MRRLDLQGQERRVQADFMPWLDMTRQHARTRRAAAAPAAVAAVDIATVGGERWHGAASCDDVPGSLEEERSQHLGRLPCTGRFGRRAYFIKQCCKLVVREQVGHLATGQHVVDVF